MPGPPPLRILIVNPNTTQSMTDALRPVIEGLPLTATYTYFTCPGPGIPSINSPSDAAASATYSLPHLLPLLPHHDAILIACYSSHPLVSSLQSHLQSLGVPMKPIIGIFEASVRASLAALPLYADDEAEDVGEGTEETEDLAAFGIVSTADAWRVPLEEAVRDMGAGSRFVGCETTGLNADQLHCLPWDDVRARMKTSTVSLIQRGRGDAEMGKKKKKVRAICLGCAGMAGLEEAVREACVEELGSAVGNKIQIIDGVKVGVELLGAMCRVGI